MKYLIERPDEKSFNSKTRYFLEFENANISYTNYISRTIHDDVPEWVLKNKKFENKIISSDSSVFKEILEKEIIRLKILVQNGVSEVDKDIKKLEEILKDSN
ncbi:MAG: hypothetical protein WC812_03535 [Candidatus Pacearchaeota archaeon]|jgi:hypothetical protein